MRDVRRFDTVQDHVHDRDDVGEGLFLFAVESALLQRFQVAGGEGFVRLQVIERFAQKARRTAGAVVNRFADFGRGDLHHRADQRARRVVLAAVPARVAHVLDFGFVQVRQLVLLGLRAKAQRIDMVDDFAQVVAAGNLVFDLAENFTDFVFERVRAAGFLLEALQVREERAVDEFAQVIAVSA